MRNKKRVKSKGENGEMNLAALRVTIITLYCEREQTPRGKLQAGGRNHRGAEGGSETADAVSGRG